MSWLQALLAFMIIVGLVKLAYDHRELLLQILRVSDV